MFDRIAPVYDVMNRVMTVGLDQRWRRLTADASSARATACSTPAAAPATSRSPRAKAGARRGRASTSPSGCSSARAARTPRSSGSRATCSRCRSRTRRFDAATVGFGIRNVADLERGLPSCGACCGRAAGSGSSRSRGRAGRCAPFFRLWFDVLVPLAGKVLPGGKAYTYLPASVRRFPGPEELAALMARQRLRRRRVPAARAAGSSRCTRGGRDDHARGRPPTPGLDAYLEQLEARLAAAVGAHPGRVAEVGAEALAAGGKRLRPLLVFLSRAAGASRRSQRASRSSSCTWRRSSTTT